MEVTILYIQRIARSIVSLGQGITVRTAKSIAMGDVAETILQNSISNIAKLTKLGLDYDLQSIRSELDGRQFMMFLRHSSNANEGPSGSDYET
ncbi:hypothetical protein Leryth_020564 [Lithospermum erythrorhizon]|nr:hypothetical protein Leryth_020564 [Lithospermum erythrorhizon]